MKNITVSVNESEFKVLLRTARRKGVTCYALVKGLVRDFLESNVSVFVWFWIATYYSLAVSTFILI